ncbi:MFS transporter [Halococcus sediminicola]|uniref:MFS transporter n=1 Tax=Halococcus sediminicola TaxID=1264579 RepID=UPI000678B7EC|nr:MFS transporter [Halococcus sediminicola]
MKSLIRNTAFRRLFVGRLVTNAGDSLYYVAAMWLVYDLGGSAFYTGLAGFLTLVPTTLQFLTGPFADRWDLRRLLVGTQVLQAALVLIIPVAAMTGWLSVTVVLVVMPLAAMVSQFVYPAQNAALPRIVQEEEIVDANSAFSFAYQGVDTAFSSLGGVLVALFGAVSLYLIDSVTFILTALIFAVTRIPDAESETNQENTDRVTSTFSDYVEKLREGIEYIRGTILILTLGASVIVNFMIGAMMAVLPAFAASRGGSETYGILLAAMTAGLLIGALMASPLKQVSLSRLNIIGFSLGGFAWLTAVYVQWLPVTAVLFCFAWVPVGVTNVVFMAMTQTYVPERLLGRVTSVNVSASAAAMPVGSLLGGVAGDAIGSTVVVGVTGVGFLFVTLYWLSHPLLRYVPSVEKLDPSEYGLGQL